MIQDYAPRLRAKKEKKELLDAIIGGVGLAILGVIILIFLSLLSI